MTFNENDYKYMRRALQLAAAGRGHVSPNPMVGAVIVAPTDVSLAKAGTRNTAVRTPKSML